MWRVVLDYTHLDVYTTCSTKNWSFIFLEPSFRTRALRIFENVSRFNNRSIIFLIEICVYLTWYPRNKERACKYYTTITRLTCIAYMWTPCGNRTADGIKDSIVTLYIYLKFFFFFVPTPQRCFSNSIRMTSIMFGCLR